MAGGRIDPVEVISSAMLDGAFRAVVTKPPALTRLEPQSISGDPAPGVEARIADPLWLLGRQWQLGELLGEDVGTVVSVTVKSQALPITAWAPAGRMDGTDAAREPQWRPWPAGAILEELIEDVPRIGYERGVRWSAETGSALHELLTEAGQDDAAAALLAAHPLTAGQDPLDPSGVLDPAADRLLLTLAGVVPSGASARLALESGEPAWVSGAADVAGVRQVAADWLSWVQGAPDSGGAWTTTRLEHRFWLRFGHGADAVVVEATEFSGGATRWHHLRWVPDATVRLPGDDQLAGPVEREDVMLATPLRYPGQPADRYWQLEEGSIDVAAIEAQPHDLARLCLAEFALVSGDDWLIVPVDGLAGAVNRIISVRVRTTFGEDIEIPDASGERRGRGFRMFEVTADDGRELDGILLAPTGPSALTGAAVEEVAFVRDENANLAWAVEAVVPGRSGDGRQRRSEPQSVRPKPPPDREPDDVLYELTVPVPKHWIPLVPVRLAPATVGLRKGAMLDDDQPVPAAGLLLEPTPLTFPPEEIPREGVTVRAVPALARRRDGSYARWVGHRVRVGRGEASSGFASDSAKLPRKKTG